MTEFEKMGCTYRQEGDYFLPNLKIGEQDEVLIGVWGQRHRQYLKKHHHVRYYNLLTAGALNSYGCYSFHFHESSSLWIIQVNLERLSILPEEHSSSKLYMPLSIKAF